MTSSSTRTQLIGLAGWLLICSITAAVGAFASIEASSFYAALARPDWAPPAWLFGPVWTLLYVLMAIAAWLVWRRSREDPRCRAALGLFVVQLMFNALWSWLFFGWHHGALAFVEIVLLWFLIVATVLLFWRVQRVAAVMLFPYLLWVSFAAVLNYSIWWLNPTLLA
jgi:benzodiazapine receptor